MISTQAHANDSTTPVAEDQNHFFTRTPVFSDALLQNVEYCYFNVQVYVLPILRFIITNYFTYENHMLSYPPSIRLTTAP